MKEATAPTLQEQRKEIQDRLEESTESHLADGLDLVSDQHITSIYEMIQHNRSNNVYRSRIRTMIIQDVAAILENKPDAAIYSKPFLKPL